MSAQDFRINGLVRGDATDNNIYMSRLWNKPHDSRLSQLFLRFQWRARCKDPLLAILMPHKALRTVA